MAIICAFILFDIITGWIKSIANGNYKSTKMKKGLYSKCGEMLTLIFMYGIEYAVPIIGIETTIPFVKATCAYITIMEITSIVENLGAINPQLSDLLSHIFEDFKKGE